MAFYFKQTTMSCQLKVSCKLVKHFVCYRKKNPKQNTEGGNCFYLSKNRAGKFQEPADSFYRSYLYYEGNVRPKLASITSVPSNCSLSPCLSAVLAEIHVFCYSWVLSQTIAQWVKFSLLKQLLFKTYF